MKYFSLFFLSVMCSAPILGTDTPIQSSQQNITQIIAHVRAKKIACMITEGSNRVSVLDLAKNKLRKPITIEISSNLSDIAVTPDEPFAYVTDSEENTVTKIDLNTYTVVGSPLTVGLKPVSIAITPNKEFAYIVNNESNDVSIVDLETFQIIPPTLSVGQKPSSIVIPLCGGFAYVANSESRTISIIDLETNTVLDQSISVPLEPTRLAIEENGKVLLVAYKDCNLVSIIDLNTSTIITTHRMMQSFIQSMFYVKF